jgi:hypothetical protein
MSRTVQCQMLNQELEGRAFQPWPGEMGKRVFDNLKNQIMHPAGKLSIRSAHSGHSNHPIFQG